MTAVIASPLKDQKPCIFCGQYGNKSKEHFYPNWLSEHIDGKGIYHTTSVLMQRGFSPREVTKKTSRQGHLITKKLRVVCETCNNGWMSQLENAAKPTLIAGVQGMDLSLTYERQITLAKWVCLKTIICEHANSELASTPFVDRNLFYREGRIPAYFRIYFGTHSTGSVTWLYRHSATISFTKDIRPPLLDGLQRNVQTVTFIFGRYLFHVLAPRVDQFGISDDITYPGLTSIWPISRDVVDTNSVRCLNDSQVLKVMMSFEEFLVIKRPTFVDAVI